MHIYIYIYIFIYIRIYTYTHMYTECIIKAYILNVLDTVYDKFNRTMHDKIIEYLLEKNAKIIMLNEINNCAKENHEITMLDKIRIRVPGRRWGGGPRWP